MAGKDYLAVVDRGGELPALLVHVDLGRGSVRIRPVSARAPTDRDLEVWYVGKGGKPLSLGVIASAEIARPIPATVRDDALAEGQIAVSDEPKGGSPTGAPTGPVIYSGKLIRAGR